MVFEKNRINFGVVAKLLGLLLLIEAVFMLPSLFVSIAYGETEAMWSFVYAIAITAGVGTIGFVYPIRNRDMGRREGFLLTSLTWFIFSIFGMIPFLLKPCGLPVADAFFETMSGLTTTGASIMTDIDTQSHGILLWRAVTHFIGGMGIILFTLAVIPMLNKQSGLQLFNAEVTGLTHEKIRPRISNTAKTLWAIYLSLTIALVLLLWLGPMDLFDAVCYGFSAIATGGFAPHNDSVAYYDSTYVKIVMTVFMFIAGISFSLIYRIIKGDFKSLLQNDVTRWYIKIVVSSMVAIGIIEYVAGDEPWQNLLADVPFQTVSAITSSGFNATDINLWQHGSIIIVIALMMSGACAGSTTGGVKIDRIVLIVKNLKNEMHRILFPNTISPVRVNGKILSGDMTAKVGAFLMLFALCLLAGSFLLALSGINLFDSIFASMSCLSNNGLGYGFTGDSFADINAFGKWVLSLLMLIGRLEFSAVIILFTQAFWSK